VVGRALRPLQATATAIGERQISDLSPLELNEAVEELRPVLRALNNLFERLALARLREAHLTASAAHELKTPLAGLKAQAQIALVSPEAEARTAALKQISTAVDRSSRLVNQLLEMARQDSRDDAVAPAVWVVLAHAWTQAVTDVAATSRARSVRLELQAPPAELHVSPELLQAILRNLLGNAVQYAKSRVVARLERSGVNWRLVIEDDGPGIAFADLPRVRERFYRGRHAQGIGSGLGLSIVDLAVEHAGFSLELEHTAAGGLAAVVTVPGNRVRELSGAGDAPASAS